MEEMKGRRKQARREKGRKEGRNLGTLRLSTQAVLIGGRTSDQTVHWDPNIIKNKKIKLKNIT